MINLLIIELEKLRAKAESYKVLYDAGKPLPEDTEDDFFPDYFKDNSTYKSQIVEWMVEYNVPGNQHPCLIEKNSKII